MEYEHRIPLFATHRINCLVEIYQMWIESTPNIISKKLQMLRIQSETTEQTTLREAQINE
jgi:hypothetical protein